MGVLSYLGILVLIPVLAGNKQSEYVRHHANQGMVIFSISLLSNFLAGSGVFGIFSFPGFFAGTWLGWICNLLDLVLLVLIVVGIVYACRGDKRELPFVGQIKIFK